MHLGLRQMQRAADDHAVGLDVEPVDIGGTGKAVQLRMLVRGIESHFESGGRDSAGGPLHPIEPSLVFAGRDTDVVVDRELRHRPVVVDETGLGRDRGNRHHAERAQCGRTLRPLCSQRQREFFDVAGRRRVTQRAGVPVEGEVAAHLAVGLDRHLALWRRREAKPGGRAVAGEQQRRQLSGIGVRRRAFGNRGRRDRRGERSLSGRGQQVAAAGCQQGAGQQADADGAGMSEKNGERFDHDRDPVPCVPGRR